MQPSRKRVAEQQSGSANTGRDAGPSSRRQRGSKQEPAAVAVKEEGSEGAPGPVDNTLAQSAADMRRAADILSTTLPQVVKRPLRKSTAEQQSGNANTGGDAGPSSRRPRSVKQEPAGAVPIKQESTQAMPGSGMGRSTQAKRAKPGKSVASVKARAEATLARLTSALRNTRKGTFPYYVLAGHELPGQHKDRKVSSQHVVRKILQAFIDDADFYLLGGRYISDSGPITQPTEAQELKYVDSIKEQLSTLIGVTPRFELTETRVGMRWAWYKEFGLEHTP